MIVRRAAALAALVLTAAAPSARIGVEMPQAGDDGGAGLAALTAIRLALNDRVVARDTSAGGFQNPHRDEASDNDVDVFTAPAIVTSFARDSRVVAAIGGLRRNVGDADAARAERANLPLITLARWSRERRVRRHAFCVCVSPRILIAGARQIAAMHFGRRIAIVFVGPAKQLPRAWPEIVTGVETAAADGVIVVADERPLVAMRSAMFRTALEGGYLRQLVQRGFHLAPAGSTRSDVLVISERVLPNGAVRRSFVHRFHTVAGYQPPDAALRAYAAAQILQQAGTTREAVRSALSAAAFPTAAGLVRFDRDGFWDRSMVSASPP